MRRAARVPGVVAPAVAGLLLAGCSPETGYVLGLTVDDEGRVVAAVAVCEGDADLLVLEQWSGTGPAVERRDWDIDAEAGLDFFPLSTDGSRSRSQQLGIEIDEQMVLSPATSDNRWSGQSVIFTRTELDQLEEGRIWWQPGESTDDRVVTTVSEFESAACRWLRPLG